MPIKEYTEIVAWIIGLLVSSLVFVQPVLRPSFNREFGKYLSELNISRLANKWPIYFLNIFSTIFGDKTFTLKRIVSASIASGLSLAIVTLIIFYYDPATSFEALLARLTGEAFGMPLWIYFSLANMIPDYISLTETYFMIVLMTKFSKIYQLALIMLMDVLFTAAIYFLVYGIFIYLGTGSVSFAVENNIDTARNVFFRLPGPGDSVNYMNFHNFYTTFLTSIWLWGFAIAVISQRMFHAVLGPIWMKMISIIYVEKYPMVGLALGGALIVAICSILAYPFTF